MLPVWRPSSSSSTQRTASPAAEPAADGSSAASPVSKKEAARDRLDKARVPFWRALREADYDTVRKLLAQLDVDPGSRRILLNTVDASPGLPRLPLSVAARDGDLRMVGLLLESPPAANPQAGENRFAPAPADVLVDGHATWGVQRTTAEPAEQVHYNALAWAAHGLTDAAPADYHFFLEVMDELHGRHHLPRRSVMLVVQGQAHPELVAWLVRRGAAPEEFHEAMRQAMGRGDLEAVCLYIDVAKVSPDLCMGPMTNQPLMLVAIDQNNAALLERLLERGAKINPSVYGLSSSCAVDRCIAADRPALLVRVIRAGGIVSQESFRAALNHDKNPAVLFATLIQHGALPANPVDATALEQLLQNQRSGRAALMALVSEVRRLVEAQQGKSRKKQDNDANILNLRHKVEVQAKDLSDPDSLLHDIQAADNVDLTEPRDDLAVTRRRRGLLEQVRKFTVRPAAPSARVRRALPAPPDSFKG